MTLNANDLPDAGAGGASDPLRAALAQLSEGVIVTDAIGRIVFVNDAAARLHGVARLDVEPEGYAESYHLYTEDGRPYPSTELPLARAVRRGERVVDERWRIRRPDGTEVLAVGSASPVRGPDGAQVGAVLTVRDDTARAAADAAVRERDALASRLRAAFEQSPVSTVVYDAAGRPLAVNPAFERLWGAALSDVPPGYSVLADPQLEAAGVLPLLRRAFAGEAVTLPAIRYEMESAVGRGRVLWTEAHLYPVRDAAGAVEQVVLTHEDVTGRREAEASLAETVARSTRLQALTAALAGAATPDEVAEIAVGQGVAATGASTGMLAARDPASPDEGTILRQTGFPAGLATRFARFPLDMPTPTAWCIGRGEPVFLESRDGVLGRFPGSAEVWDRIPAQALAAVPLVVAGRSVGALTFTWTAPRPLPAADREFFLALGGQCAQALERTRLFAAERAARAEAEAANRAKSEFLAVMSHELRTPLNAIGGYAELIEMGLRGPVTDQQREDLERIQRSQRHLLGLINEVLNYARLETGTVRYDVTDVGVGGAVAAVESLVLPQVREKALALDASACDPRLIVRADKEKLQQILVNLLSNAVKFTDRGGCITVSAHPLASSGGSPVAIAVRDTGVGIPADKLEAIFEPFVQVGRTLHSPGEGTGLGLAISRDLARGMGGDLTVESAVGRGSTFTLTLPRA